MHYLSFLLEFFYCAIGVNFTWRNLLLGLIVVLKLITWLGRRLTDETKNRTDTPNSKLSSFFYGNRGIMATTSHITKLLPCYHNKRTMRTVKSWWTFGRSLQHLKKEVRARPGTCFRWKSTGSLSGTDLSWHFFRRSKKDHYSIRQDLCKGQIGWKIRRNRKI